MQSSNGAQPVVKLAEPHHTPKSWLEFYSVVEILTLLLTPQDLNFHKFLKTPQQNGKYYSQLLETKQTHEC